MAWAIRREVPTQPTLPVRYLYGACSCPHLDNSHTQTNNALLINFRLSSDAEILLIKHRLSMQIGAKRAKKRACNVYIFQLSSLSAYHLWWLGRT